jgi:telomere length regulation protein
MIVGTAISALIDGPDKRMSFDTDEMDSVEAKWYLSLTTIKFEIGSLEGLKSRLLSGRGEVRLSRGRHQTNYSPRNQKKRPVVDAAPNSKILEVVDSDNDLDDGLVPYEKPDSDKEDEDEDPTIVRRDKPMPPVYVDISPL